MPGEWLPKAINAPAQCKTTPPHSSFIQRSLARLPTTLTPHSFTLDSQPQSRRNRDEHSKYAATNPRRNLITFALSGGASTLAEARGAACARRSSTLGP